MVSLGSKLGLYKAMAGAGPLSATELAARAGCAERYVREWLNAQAAGGYVDYHAVSDTYELSPEQALVLADEDSPVYIPHAWNVPASMWFDEAQGDRGVPHRQGRGLGRARRPPPLRRGGLLPQRLPRQPRVRSGCPRSTAWWSSSRPASPWPTSAAATATRPC